VETHGAGDVLAFASESFANMKLSPTQIREFAADAHFPPENLEKVLRLRELLIEFHKHTVLNGKLALKGGTALNLFYLNLARLSVDVDLHYIGHVDREATLKDRPEIRKAVEQITTGLGYQLQNGVDDYALREWYLNFTNYAARPDRIQVEINFLMRACALPPQERNAAAIGEAAPCLGRICSAAPDPGRPPALMAGTKPLLQGPGFRVPFFEGSRSCSPLRVYFRRRSSATGSKEGRSAHRGRSEVRTSQSSPFTQQLDGEQGESRTEICSGNLASRKDSDDARSVHAGRRR
jgi:hypothetical protein